VNLLNGKFLTNKIINQLLNHKYDLEFNIIIFPVIITDLLFNYWLAGFTEANGKFIIISESISEEQENNNLTNEINLSLEFKNKTYDLLSIIQKNFGGDIQFSNDDEKVFIYKSNNIKSAKLFANYFDKFQLNSSKHINYLK
jgi:hypothetical protein